MASKKPYTADGFRHYTCSRCGKEVTMPLDAWRKLAGADKRHCTSCTAKEAKGKKPVATLYEQVKLGKITTPKQLIDYARRLKR